MTLFMYMGLGLKTPPRKLENIPKLEFSLGLGHKNDIIHGYGVRVEKTPPEHENIPKLELSLGLGHKIDIIHGYVVRVETPPPNIKIFQNWNSH